MSKDHLAARDVAGATDISERQGAAAHGIHPAAIRLGMAAAAWFVVALVIAFSGTAESAYLMGIVIVASVMFFALTLGLGDRVAHESRWAEPPYSFARFLRDNVAIATGRIQGREALVQLLALPASLAIGATLIGLVFAIEG